MGVFRQIKALARSDRPVAARARVVTVGRSTARAGVDPVLPVEVQVTGTAGESYALVTALTVPLEHAHEVAPGASFPVWIDHADPEGLVVDWG